MFFVGADAFDSVYQQALAHPLPVVNYRKRSPCLVALASTYGLPLNDSSVADVSERVNFRRVQFLRRMYELAKYDKYFLVRGIIPNQHYFNAARAVAAFRLCAKCHPTTLIYPTRFRNKTKFRSCGHANLCPSCWCNIAMRQFQQIRFVINSFAQANLNAGICATAYTTAQTVSLPFIQPNTLASPDDFNLALQRIQSAICEHKRNIAQQRKKVQRSTIGAYWRIVALPEDGCCRVQLRQIFLTLPETKPPIIRPRRSPNIKTLINKRVFEVSSADWHSHVASREYAQFADMMLAFLQYPTELLTEDLDLTAAVLNAAAKQRLIGGYGKLRAAGDGLLKKMRRKKS